LLHAENETQFEKAKELTPAELPIYLTLLCLMVLFVQLSLSQLFVPSIFL